MAAAHIQAPGTGSGPCSTPCGHTDCAMSRKMAETVCTICKTAIGYDRSFYSDHEHGICHASCLEDAIDAARAQPAKP